MDKFSPRDDLYCHIPAYYIRKVGVQSIVLVDYLCYSHTDQILLLFHELPMSRVIYALFFRRFEFRYNNIILGEKQLFHIGSISRSYFFGRLLNKEISRPLPRIEFDVG